MTSHRRRRPAGTPLPVEPGEGAARARRAREHDPPRSPSTTTCASPRSTRGSPSSRKSTEQRRGDERKHKTRTTSCRRIASLRNGPRLSHRGPRTTRRRDGHTWLRSFPPGCGRPQGLVAGVRRARWLVRPVCAAGASHDCAPPRTREGGMVSPRPHPPARVRGGPGSCLSRPLIGRAVGPVRCRLPVEAEDLPVETELRLDRALDVSPCGSRAARRGT